MIQAILNKLCKKSTGASLDRYYLFKRFGFGAFFHNVHNADPKGLFHTHPWSGISIIFGSYIEEQLLPGGLWMIPKLSRKRRIGFAYIRAKTPHRLEVSKPVWTLFFHFRKCNKWEIIDRFGRVQTVEPWDGAKGFKDYANPEAALA